MITFTRDWRGYAKGSSVGTLADTIEALAVAEGAAIYGGVAGPLNSYLDADNRVQAQVDPAGKTVLATDRAARAAGSRQINAGAAMANADKLLSTRGRALTRWGNPQVLNGGATASPQEAGMFDTSLGAFAKLTTSGSRPSVVSPLIGAAVTPSIANFTGVLIQCRVTARPGVSYTVLRLRLCSTATSGGVSYATSFTARADGLEHWYAIPASEFQSIGGFVLGTTPVAGVLIEDRNDVVNLGFPGIQPGEAAYIGQIYLSPKGRSKAIVRFDDTLTDTYNVGSASFLADGVTQAWSGRTLLQRYGFRGCVFNLGKRIGTSNASATFMTAQELLALQDLGWDMCTQAMHDPADSLQNGARLFGPFGYAPRTLSSVDASANTLTSTAVHGITTGSPYWSYPIVFGGSDLPAPLVAGVEYWTRASTANVFTLHPSENAAIANTSVIDITTTGNVANFFYRYSRSSNDSSAIRADYDLCRDTLIGIGINPLAANCIALNQGAYDPYVAQALIEGGYEFVAGIQGAGGNIAVGEVASGYRGGSALCTGGNFLTHPAAIQTDGAVTEAAVRAFVQEQVRCGAMFSNYHHALTNANGLVLNAYLDELRIQQDAGALDIVTPTELVEYGRNFSVLPQMPLGVVPA